MGSLGAYDLWMTNGEEASTNIIDHNLWPIPENPWTNRSRPEAMLYDGRLYFSKNDASLGVELWALNEAGDGSNLLKDIRPGVPGSRPTFLGNCGAWLCFMANDGPHGNELWRTDGDLAHTQLVKDLNLDPPSSDPNSFVPMGDWLYFAADDGEVGPALWRTDGTAENTKRVWYNPISPEMGPSPLVVVGNRLYFIADDIIHGRELWVYEDGQGNPHLISDIAPGYQSSEPGYLTAAGNFLFFIANDGIHGPQLWRTNGTVSGTQMVTNMSTGPMISEGRALLEQNEKVIFFVPGNALNGYQVEMWLSDGTAVGTSSFAKLDSPPRSFAKVNAKWFFYAYSRLAGKDIPWQSDGTTVGTHSIPAPACLGDFTRYPAFQRLVEVFFLSIRIGSCREKCY
jgi:ELWxxDGT repeat protein